MSSRDIVFSAAGVGGDQTFIEDVFSTYLYTPTSNTALTINNGVDLAGKGGMVWLKGRTNTVSHGVFDTNRGTDNYLSTDLSSGQFNAPSNGLSSFNSNGFSLDPASYWGGFNSSTTAPTVSWTFRKQPKFFDVVTWTGNDSSPRAITHNLASTPGMIIIKRLDVTQDWWVFHRSAPGGFNGYGRLNTTAAWQSIDSGITSVGTSSFTISSFYNASGNTFVAYLFAHDAGGFGELGTDNVISCGTYTGNSSVTGPVVSLGYEPQYLMIKNATGTGNWQLLDVMRGMPVGSADATLQANLANAESSVDYVSPTATGFQVTSTSTQVNTNASTYIYMAIRRGPMRVPTTSTEVFDVKTANSVAANTPISTTNLVDAVLYLVRSGGAISSGIFFDRMRGLQTTNSPWLGTAITNAQFGQTTSCLSAQQNTGFIDNFTNANLGAINIAYSTFKRAPNFFDVVCYTGTGNGTTISHNLGVVPELTIFKSRSVGGPDWVVRAPGTGNDRFLLLNLTNAEATASNWYSATTSQITFATSYAGTANTGTTYVAYLFASCPGVSKVGSYTGTGATQTISCGFTGGARFVMIKRTDSTGDWYVWDSARGIVAGNDPYLLLNSDAAEVTNTDYVDVAASGFEISSTAPAAINANGGTFIFLAIA
jgi:hypothetical protein